MNIVAHGASRRVSFHEPVRDSVERYRNGKTEWRKKTTACRALRVFDRSKKHRGSALKTLSTKLKHNNTKEKDEETMEPGEAQPAGIPIGGGEDPNNALRFEDLTIDDDLPLLDRVVRYCRSGIALQRLVHVKMLAETAETVGCVLVAFRLCLVFVVERERIWRRFASRHVWSHHHLNACVCVCAEEDL